MRYVNSYLYDKPSILIGRKGTIDQPQFVTYPFWTVDTLFYSEINPDVIPFFLFLVVQSINWQKYNEATGVPSLNTTSINSVKVCIPSNEKEQEKIANFLTLIDKKIEAVARQIEAMEEFKKGLLKKMFV
jgi:type I restriction enzyme, S subunit